MSYILYVSSCISYCIHTLIILAPPIRCTDQLGPPQNGTINDHSVPALPGTQVTFQCDDGLFSEGIMIFTCLDTGEWSKNPGEIVCRGKYHLYSCIYIDPLIQLSLSPYSLVLTLVLLFPLVWLSRELCSQSLDCCLDS